MHDLRLIQEADVAGKRVLVRCDFNVPMKGGEIIDDARIRAAIPTINLLREAGASVILCSHLGRPKGQRSADLSLRQITGHLSKLLGVDVSFSGSCQGQEARNAAEALGAGDVLLLENLRFEPGEEANDTDFAKGLAALADLYVSDAFGTVHRAHASTAGVAEFLPSYAGLLIQKEVESLGVLLQSPPRPFVAIMGGAKVADKIPILENLINRADRILIGGGMAYTFFKAQGGEIGKSLLDEASLGFVQGLMEEHGDKILLPVDSVCASAVSADAETAVHSSDAVPTDEMGLDIGPKASAAFRAEIARAGSVLWNGPMGVFEIPSLASGTKAVGAAMAESDGLTVVGGGDSASAAKKFGFDSQLTHVSTGGGASLEYLEGKELPGLQVLRG